MHNIYTTEGFILKSAPYGEANLYFLIFTRDFGLIRATAQGVRLLKSKLRYGLVDQSLVSVSLVRGQDLWRITSVQNIFKAADLSLISVERYKLISRIFSLVLRLVQGEEKNEKLFENLKTALIFLRDGTIETNQLADLECILALRILSNLGYIGEIKDFAQFIESEYFTSELISKMSVLKTRAVMEINKSLKETHL